MWTEDDLRAELAMLGRPAADRGAALTERVLAGAHVRRGGRSLRVSAVAAAVVLALAIPATIGGALFVGVNRPSANPAAPADAARSPFEVTFSQASVAGNTVFTVKARAGGQEVSLASPEGWVFHLSIEDPGGAEPALAGDAIPLAVAGQPGFLVADAPDPDDPRRSAGPLLQWQYRDGAWAVLRLDLGGRPDDGTARDRLLAIARGLRLSSPTPLTFPLRLRSGSAGLRVSAVQVSHGAVGPGLDEAELTCVDPSTGDELFVRVSQGSAFGLDQKAGASDVRPNRTVAGHPAWYSRDTLVVDFGTFSVSLFSPNAPQRFSEGALERSVAAMTFATWADRSSWYDVSTVLPG